MNGDGCTIIWMFLILLKCTLNDGCGGKSYVYFTTRKVETNEIT